MKIFCLDLNACYYISIFRLIAYCNFESKKTLKKAQLNIKLHTWIFSNFLANFWSVGTQWEVSEESSDANPNIGTSGGYPKTENKGEVSNDMEHYLGSWEENFSKKIAETSSVDVCL